MHVLIVTVGTRGDVQPYVALALGLVRADFEVTLASHREHRDFVTSWGLPFRDAGASMREVLESDVGRDWIESSDSMGRYMKALRRLGDVMVPDNLAKAEAMTEGVDALLIHPFAMHAFHQAEARRLPAVIVGLIPFEPSSEMAPVFFPNAPRWGWLRRWLTHTAHKQGYATVAHHHEPYRKKLGIRSAGNNILLAVRSVGIPVLHLYSEVLVPRPSDWPDDVVATGFCFLDAHANWTPPEPLVRFLEAGESPIYIGFGSMTGRDPAELTRTVLEAVRTAGVRAVVGNGWGGTSKIEGASDVFVVDDVPHDWLFPRVRAVVHHGGAGTVSAGLRAGRPTAVAAFFADQPFWGHVTTTLGAGPRPLLKREIDSAHLAAKLRELLQSKDFAKSARLLGERLTAEDGVGNAVAFITKQLERPRDSFWRS
jgi:sterol 3beta-glucosyltransferase